MDFDMDGFAYFFGISDYVFCSSWATKNRQI